MRRAGGQSFGSSERLKGGRFQALFRQGGRRDERPSFVALWRANDGRTKVGFAVGRRIGGSVCRNRARRRLREAYRRHGARLPSGVDIVFVGRPAVLTRNFAEILEDMRQTMDAIATALGRARSQPRSGAGG